MFLYQGQKSFYLWNKINPEIDEKLINKLLSKLNEKNWYNRFYCSGKTTAGKIISKNKGPIFSADNRVKKLYKKKI